MGANDTDEDERQNVKEILQQAISDAEGHTEELDAVVGLPDHFSALADAWQEVAKDYSDYAGLLLERMKLAGLLGDPSVPYMLVLQWEEEHGKLTGPFGIKGRRWREGSSEYWRLHGIMTEANKALRGSIEELWATSEELFEMAEAVIDCAEEHPQLLLCLTGLADRYEVFATAGGGERWLASIVDEADRAVQMQEGMPEAYKVLQESYTDDLHDPWRPT